MLSQDQRAEFYASGLLKVKSLLSEKAIEHARTAILQRFEPLGLSLGGKWQLENVSPTGWPDKGYKAKEIGNKVEEVERLLDEPGVKPMANALLDDAELDHEFFKRPQILVTLPNAGEWFMPNNGWHVDVPRLSTGACPGVQIFILLSEIKPGGGGTLAISGSHQLLNNEGFIRSRDVTKRLRAEPLFQAFMSEPRHTIDWFEVQAPTTEPVEVKVVELTGAPGDAYFIDLRTLHSGAPNMSHKPRMMATHRFLRADAAKEMAVIRTE